jgi:hypothetical protein
VLEALADAGIEAVLLKGPSTAAWLYAPGERSYVDLDVLVGEADFERLDVVLRRLGYRDPIADAAVGERNDHAVSYFPVDAARATVGATEVDVHFTLPGTLAPPTEVFAELRRRTVAFSLAGGTVPALDHVGRALVLVLHAARDARRKPQSFEDLVRLVGALPDDAWPQAAALARRLGAEESFAAGLLLLDDGRSRLADLGLAEPTHMAALLHRPDVPFTAHRLEKLTQVPGWRPRAAMAARELWPTTDWLRWWAGEVGLPATHPTLLRARRITHVLRSAPPALRAWLRVRGEARAALTQRAGRGERRVNATPHRQSAPPTNANAGGTSPSSSQLNSTVIGGTR